MDKLLNQEFVYRQIPVNYNGVGRLDTIKGNTIKFNQLIDPDDFGVVVQASYTWTKTNGSINITGTSNSTGVYRFSNLLKLITGHKYFMKGCPANGSSSTWCIRLTGQNIYDYGSGVIFQFTELPSSSEYIRAYVNSSSESINITFTPQLYDLTLMGIDNLTTPTQVEEWLSTHIGLLPYYDYTLGDLISFKGTGLKVVGKNLADIVLGTGQQGNVVFSVNKYTLTSGTGGSAFFFNIKILKGNTYNLSFNLTSGQIANIRLFSDLASSSLLQPIVNSVNTGIFSLPITFTEDGYLRFWIQGTCVLEDLQLELGNQKTSYSPYTETTLSLPTLDYFPTGMKSAGTAYDRYDGKRADKVLSEPVNLGDLAWYAGYTGYIATVPVKVVPNDEVSNMICSKYITTAYLNAPDKSIQTISGTSYIRVLDSDYSDATTFKQAMNGVMLIYELANPITTDITPPLDLTYPIENGGTEQLLPVNTSTPTTSNILCDQSYSTGIVEVITHPMPESGGETSGDGWYLVGEEATVIGTPNEHYVFDNWELDGEVVSTDATYTFEVSDE